MDEVKITERGWCGHYLMSSRCRFRRNTLLEYEDRKWIVSTVGAQFGEKGELEQITHRTYYETRCFEANNNDEYHDVDVSKEITIPTINTRIRADSVEDLCETYVHPDLVANEMHEQAVRIMMNVIKSPPMTNEKAIEILNSWDRNFIGYSSDEVNEAIDLAIKALS